MICYRLRCGDAHDFEGWFRSGDDFERQSVARLVECPACGDTRIERALMAPAVVGARKRLHVTAPRQAAEGEVIPPDRPADLRRVAGGELPAAMRALLGRMRDEIERTCDDVGREFAETALRMHRGDEEKRGIYGETTDLEREILADEGVEIARMPWIKRTDG